MRLGCAAGVCGSGVRLVWRTACGLVETIDLLDLRGVDALEHQLGHTVADLDCRDGTRAAERQRPGRSLRASALSAQLSQAGSDLGVGRVRWRSRAAGRTLWLSNIVTNGAAAMDPTLPSLTLSKKDLIQLFFAMVPRMNGGTLLGFMTLLPSE